MLGKTHLVMATATALCLIHSVSFSQKVAIATMAGIGGLMPDTDSNSSIGARITKKVLVAVIIGTMIVTIFTGDSMTLGILEGHTWVTMTGLLIIFAMCVFGMFQAHRGIMHSLLMMLLGTIAVGMTGNKDMSIAFLIGYMLHLCLDMMNYQGIELLWPYKKKVAFSICRADGIIDKILLTVGGVITLVCLL